MLGLCLVIVFLRFAHDASPATWTYYTMLKFHWSMWQVSQSLMAVGFITALVYGGLTRLVIPLIGEVRAVYCGFAAGAIACLGYAFSTQGWMLYGWMVVGSLMGLAMPALNAIMSKGGRPVRAGRIARRYRQYRKFHVDICAAGDLLSSSRFSPARRLRSIFRARRFSPAGMCIALAAVSFSLVKPHAIDEPAHSPGAAE